jgi:hypothetical protein
MKKFSLCHLDKNKLMYELKEYSICQILEQINNSIILVLDDYCGCIGNFVSFKKYYRYFKDELYNMDKTSYIIWSSDNSCDMLLENSIISHELLTNLPLTIKYIKFNDKYDYSIDVLMEKNITHIIFGYEFNNSVDNLPWKIEYLYFGYKFNQLLENLPGCMRKLIFPQNSQFNNQLDCLPNSIEYLFLPIYYSKQIDNLPNSIFYLELNYQYPHTLNNLPKSLNKFIFYYSSQNNNNRFHIIQKSSLDEFLIPKINCYYDDRNKPEINWIERVFVSLPSNLKFLDLTYSYKLNLLSDYINWNNKVLNQHIRKEVIKNSQILDNLPENLEVLKYPTNYDLILIDKIPQNIKRLFFSNKFNKSVDKLLNPNFGTSKQAPSTKLSHLIFGEEFNQSVNFLPNTITHLYFGDKFDKFVDKLPSSLIVISFGTNFNKTINNLPEKVEEIILGLNFNQSLNNIKPKCKKIKFQLSNFFTSSFDKYYYDKKIIKLPIETKIYLSNVEVKSSLFKNDYFYSIFNQVNDNIIYY